MLENFETTKDVANEIAEFGDFDLSAGRNQFFSPHSAGCAIQKLIHRRYFTELTTFHVTRDIPPLFFSLFAGSETVAPEQGETLRLPNGRDREHPRIFHVNEFCFV